MPSVVYPSSKMTGNHNITVLRRILLLLQTFAHQTKVCGLKWKKIEKKRTDESLAPDQRCEFRKYVQSYKILVQEVVMNDDLQTCCCEKVKDILGTFHWTESSLGIDMSTTYDNSRRRRMILGPMKLLDRHIEKMCGDLRKIIEKTIENPSDEVLRIAQSLSDVSMQDTPPHEVLRIEQLLSEVSMQDTPPHDPLLQFGCMRL